MVEPVWSSPHAPASWPGRVASCPAICARRAVKLACLAMLLLSLIACRGSATGPGSPTIGQGGGTASLAGGSVRLSVPSGALAASVDFTADPAASVPQTGLLVPGSAYYVGPPGTTFTRLATLTVAYDPGALPPGVRQSELRLQQVLGDGWSVAVGSTVDSAKHVVSGKIDAVGTFGVVALPADSIMVYPTRYTLGAGETARLNRSIYGPSGEALPYRRATWTSSDETVATVDTAGVVTGVGAGAAAISASVDGHGAKASVTVFDCSAQTSVPASQCLALIAVYDAYTNSEWRTTGSLAAGPDPCSWSGVTCAGGSVSGLTLGLTPGGSISYKVGDLAGLISLDISGVHLTGTLPSSLGSLAKLETLSIHSSSVSGSIPPELGQLSNLKELDLYSDSLSGSIPPELGNLSSLVTLDLIDNQLTGPIPPELGNLSSLQVLDLVGNQLTGSIPGQIGNLANLQQLSLAWNRLTGTIPKALGNLSSLTNLGLFNNQLSGSIPAEIGNLAKLEALTLWGNNLTGPVPLSVAQLGGQLQSKFNVQACVFIMSSYPGNTGLSIPDTQEYRAADLDGDGRICFITIGSP